MAHLTASQKKNRNIFIALSIAIILVAAATVYVIYGELTSKSALLENQKLAAALSEVLGKTPRGISEKDLSAVKYLELRYDSESKQYSLAAGYDEFITEYDKYLAAKEQDENAEQPDFSKYIKSATFKGTDEDVFPDIKFFTGVDTVSLSSVKLPADISFDGFTNLRKGYFYNCGLTSTSGFANLDLSKVEELDFTGNEIEDWSALESISDKVIVSNYYTIESDDDGNTQFVPVTETLTDKLNAKESEEADGESAEESADGENGEATESDADENTEADIEAGAETETEANAEAEANTEAEANADPE